MALKWLRDNLRHLKFVLWGVVIVFVLLVFVDWGSGRAGGGRSGYGSDFPRRRRDGNRFGGQRLSQAARSLRRARAAGGRTGGKAGDQFRHPRYE